MSVTQKVMYDSISDKLLIKTYLDPMDISPHMTESRFYAEIHTEMTKLVAAKLFEALEPAIDEILAKYKGSTTTS